MDGWAALVGAVGTVLGGIITALGFQLRQFAKDRGQQQHDSHADAIAAYRSLLDEMREERAQIVERLSRVEAAESECRSRQAEQNVRIEYLQTEVRSLRLQLGSTSTPHLADHLLENLTDAIICIDQHGTILSFSPAASHLLGWLPGEILGKSIETLMPEKEAVKHQGHIDTYMATREPHIIGSGRKVDALHKNGTLIPVELSVSVVSVMNSEQVYFMGVLRPVEAE